MSDLRLSSCWKFCGNGLILHLQFWKNAEENPFRYNVLLVFLSVDGTLRRFCLICVRPLAWGYAMLMSPDEDETAVHGCQHRGDMVVRIRKVLAIELVRVLQCLNRFCLIFHVRTFWLVLSCLFLSSYQYSKNLRVTTSLAKICQLGPLYTRTCCAQNLKMVLIL